MESQTFSIMFNCLAGFVFLIAVLIAAFPALGECHDRELKEQAAESTRQLVELAVASMWQQVKDKELDGIDQAIFVCASLTQINRSFGSSLHATIPVIGSDGKATFITVRSQ